MDCTLYWFVLDYSLVYSSSNDYFKQFLGLAQLLDKHLNPFCRDEVLVMILLLSFLSKLLITKYILNSIWLNKTYAPFYQYLKLNSSKSFYSFITSRMSRDSISVSNKVCYSENDINTIENIISTPTINASNVNANRYWSRTRSRSNISLNNSYINAINEENIDVNNAEVLNESCNVTNRLSIDTFQQKSESADDSTDNIQEVNKFEGENESIAVGYNIEEFSGLVLSSNENVKSNQDSENYVNNSDDVNEDNADNDDQLSYIDEDGDDIAELLIDDDDDNAAENDSENSLEAELGLLGDDNFVSSLAFKNSDNRVRASRFSETSSKYLYASPEKNNKSPLYVSSNVFMIGPIELDSQVIYIPFTSNSQGFVKRLDFTVANESDFVLKFSSSGTRSIGDDQITDVNPSANAHDSRRSSVNSAHMETSSSKRFKSTKNLHNTVSIGIDIELSSFRYAQMLYCSFYSIKKANQNQSLSKDSYLSIINSILGLYACNIELTASASRSKFTLTLSITMTNEDHKHIRKQNKINQGHKKTAIREIIIEKAKLSLSFCYEMVFASLQSFQTQANVYFNGQDNVKVIKYELIDYNLDKCYKSVEVSLTFNDILKFYYLSKKNDTLAVNANKDLKTLEKHSVFRKLIQLTTKSCTDDRSFQLLVFDLLNGLLGIFGLSVHQYLGILDFNIDYDVQDNNGKSNVDGNIFGLANSNEADNITPNLDYFDKFNFEFQISIPRLNLSNVSADVLINDSIENSLNKNSYRENEDREINFNDIQLFQEYIELIQSDSEVFCEIFGSLVILVYIQHVLS